MKVIELRNQEIQVEKVPIQGNGQPTVEGWRLLFADKGTGDVIWISFGDEVRDELVRKLTGVVIPTGKLMAVPKGKQH